MFETRSFQDRKRSFYGAIVMAVADGYIDESEKHTLMDVADRLGISAEEVERVLSDPASIEVVVPRSRAERALHVMDLLREARPDGQFEKDELRFFIMVARTYGFTSQDVMDMIDFVVCGATVDLIRVVYS